MLFDVVSKSLLNTVIFWNNYITHSFVMDTILKYCDSGIMTMFSFFTTHFSTENTLLGFMLQSYDMLIMGVLLVLNLICTQWLIRRYQRWRRYSATKIHADEEIILAQDLIPISFMADSTINSSIIAGVSLHGKGRVVLSDKRLIVGTSIGRILEISFSRKGTIRALGPKRLLLWGIHPSQVGNIRVELVLENERQWEKSAAYLLQGDT